MLRWLQRIPGQIWGFLLPAGNHLLPAEPGLMHIFLAGCFAWGSVPLGPAAAAMPVETFPVPQGPGRTVFVLDTSSNHRLPAFMAVAILDF